MRRTMFAASVSGVVLLFLLQHTTLNTVDGQIIDSNTLARIFTFFEQNYKIVEEGIERQYAVAINVPKEQCQAGFTPTEDNFLTQESPEKVKSDIRKKEDPVYEGAELIGAGVKDMGGYYIHSERLLFNPTDKRPTPPMQNLLNKRKDSCTVFYTLNSPCADICLNEKKPEYNILQGLETWSAHDPSIKALVFKQIWRLDEPRKEIFIAALKKIAKHVPVYRCIDENGNVCYACGGKDDSPIDIHCLPN